MQLKEFLDRFPPPGKVLFARVWGSRGHNCNREDSDYDFAGVYLCPTERMLSLNPPPQGFQNGGDEPRQSDGGKPHYAFHEAGRFVQLALGGNPSVLEHLFADKLYMTTPEWELLRAVRERFLSRQAVAQYVGYMRGQMRRLVSGRSLHTAGGGYNEKWAYHVLRLLGDLKRLCVGKPPQVWVEGPERDLLMRVREGGVALAEFKTLVERGVAEAFSASGLAMPPMWDGEHYAWLQQALKSVPLPEAGDEAEAEKWLLRLRRENWAFVPETDQLEGD